MKKILNLIIILMFISITKVSASIIITVPNTINDDYITDEEYINSSDIDWSKEGRGTISYLDRHNLSFQKKNIIITNMNDLLEGLNILEKIEIVYSSNITVKKKISVTNSDFFILGSIDTQTNPYETQDDKVHAYLAYYKNNMLYWNKTFKEERYGELVDGVIVDNSIAVIGKYDEVNQKDNIFINIITFEKDVVFEKVIQGSEIDIPKNIHYYKNHLYFTGYSNSKDYDYNYNISGGFNVIVGKISLLTSECSMLFLGNSGNDLLIDSVFFEDKIYLYIEFRGSGYFANKFNSNVDYLGLLYVSEYFEMDEWEYVRDITTFSKGKLFLLDNKVGVSYIDNNTRKNVLNVFSKKLEFINSYLNVAINTYSINDSLVYGFNNNLYIFSKEINQESQSFYSVQIINSNFERINYYIFNSGGNFSLLAVFNSLDSTILGLVDDVNNKVINYDYTHIKADKNKLEYANYYINDLDILINNNIASKTKLTNNTPNNAFGYYTENYQARLGNIEVVIPIESYYHLRLNIKNKEVYDIGLRLNFNGTGYLNDELITNNFQINETGKYILEIVGSNNERKIFTFNITNLSFNPSVNVEAIDYKIVLEKDSFVLDEIIKPSYVVNEIEELDKKGVIIIISLPVLATVGSLFIPLDFWRRKNG